MADEQPDYKVYRSRPRLLRKNEPDDGVYTSEYAEAAVAELEDEGLDVNGNDWEAPEVEVTEGGE